MAMVNMAANRRLLTWKTPVCVNAERDSNSDRMGSRVRVSTGGNCFVKGMRHMVSVVAAPVTKHPSRKPWLILSDCCEG